jgi:hypothetical protein
MLTILEHTSKSYGPRTYANAHKGNVTIAIAVDYNTAGEKLTHKAAGKKYIALPPEDDWIVNARRLWKKLTGSNITGKCVVNVAGNGIYTLAKHGVSQDEVNLYVYRVLGKVHTYFHIDEIISGGQTGVDLAGGVAGVALDIPTTLLLPKGFVQRHENGIDVCHTEEEIREQVIRGVEHLSQIKEME